MNTSGNNRRDFLKTTAGLAVGLTLTGLPAMAERHSVVESGNFPGAEEIPYGQQPLPYKYNALELAIDAATMDIHYSKHASGYAKNLADAVKDEKVNTEKEKLSALLGKISKYSAKMRNNAGGHYNHEFFWKSMTPSQTADAPPAALFEAIKKDFGSMEAFKTQFADAAKNRFGSGWAWLVLTLDKKLVVSSTPNQDNPLMDIADIKGIPLLGLDVWEHAYYLRYQNKRPDYINAWWSIVDWDIVNKRFTLA